MLTETKSACLKGLDAQIVAIEASSDKGIPCFHLVGLASKEITESEDRIKVALRSCGFELPPRKIIINLSPANIRKQGPQLDLGIAAALMHNLGFIACDEDFLEQFCFLGELSLSGELRPVQGILPLAIKTQEEGIKYLVVPPENEQEAKLITIKDLYGSGDKQTKIFRIKNLHELQRLIEELYSQHQHEVEQARQSKKLKYDPMFNINPYKVTRLDREELEHIFSTSTREQQDSIDQVIGQSQAKRALEIAAAGRHHALLLGPPGCGKTMLARRFQNLLPKIDYEQIIESTKIYSIVGKTQKSLMVDTPFRAPHHSATARAIIGGGVPIRPGEISMAHNGILFLDEFTEFDKFVLEQLREVLENKSITLHRGREAYDFPADFQMLATANPCACGYLGDPEIACTCSIAQIRKYASKLSGPILDRIDIQVELQRLSEEEIKELSKHKAEQGRSEEEAMRSRILKAREFEQELKGSQLFLDYYKLDQESQDFLNMAVRNLKLSARVHQKLVLIARTIANLNESDFIKIEHLAEALQFRSIDRTRYEDFCK